MAEYLLSSVLSAVRVYNPAKFNPRTGRQGGFDTITDVEVANTLVEQGKCVAFVTCEVEHAEKVAESLSAKTGFNWVVNPGKPAQPATAVSPAVPATSVSLSVKPDWKRKLKF